MPESISLFVLLGLMERTRAACRAILASSPDVIVLQEVVEPTLNVLTRTLTAAGYVLASPSLHATDTITRAPYFCAAFVSNAFSLVGNDGHLHSFRCGSDMYRDLVSFTVAPKSSLDASADSSSSSSSGGKCNSMKPVVEYTSHFESTKQGGEKRVKQ